MSDRRLYSPHFRRGPDCAWEENLLQMRGLQVPSQDPFPAPYLLSFVHSFHPIVFPYSSPWSMEHIFLDSRVFVSEGSHVTENLNWSFHLFDHSPADLTCVIRRLSWTWKVQVPCFPACLVTEHWSIMMADTELANEDPAVTSPLPYSVPLPFHTIFPL